MNLRKVYTAQETLAIHVISAGASVISAIEPRLGATHVEPGRRSATRPSLSATIVLEAASLVLVMDRSLQFKRDLAPTAELGFLYNSHRNDYLRHCYQAVLYTFTWIKFCPHQQLGNHNTTSQQRIATTELEVRLAVISGVVHHGKEENRVISILSSRCHPSATIEQSHLLQTTTFVYHLGMPFRHLSLPVPTTTVPCRENIASCSFRSPPSAYLAAIEVSEKQRC
jgi:hypothetical protein